MDLQLLREFIVLAERLNFSEAAKQLFIAQPVLSRHIAGLERQLGVQLLTRNKHSVQLTEVGKLLLNESHALLDRYKETLQKIHMTTSGLTGSLNLGYLEAPVKKFLAPLAVRFNDVNPKIQLHLFSFDFIGHLNHALKRNEIDIAFTLSLALSKDLSKTDGLSWQKVYSDVMCVVVRHDHPLVSEKSINLANLAHEPLIMLIQDNFREGYEQTLAFYESRGFTPNVVKKTSRLDTLLMLVEMGSGITILPRHIQIYANSTVKFIELEGDDTRLDVIVAWKTANSNPTIFPFLKEVDEASKNYHL